MILCYIVLLFYITGEASSISSPTSPVDGGSGVGSSQESIKRHRLQRQMAQSRKTFRFRKSKHGHHGEVKI